MRTLVLAGFLAAGSIHPLSALSIPSHARIYVDASDGFDVLLTAALEKKHVPLTVTADKSRADFALAESSADESSSHEKTASVRLVDLKSGDVIFAYSVATRPTIQGRKSAAESCAKHLGDALSSPNHVLKTAAKRLQIWPSKDPALDF